MNEREIPRQEMMKKLVSMYDCVTNIDFAKSSGITVRNRRIHAQINAKIIKKLCKGSIHLSEAIYAILGYKQLFKLPVYYVIPILNNCEIKCECGFPEKASVKFYNCENENFAYFVDYHCCVLIKEWIGAIVIMVF